MNVKAINHNTNVIVMQAVMIQLVVTNVVAIVGGLEMVLNVLILTNVIRKILILCAMNKQSV